MHFSRQFDLDQIKKDLCEKYHYEDRSEADMCKKAVSYALYPKVYEDYCEHFEIYNDVTRLEVTYTSMALEG